MDNQPEALRLADALDVALMSTELTNTAAEVLRRLHAENERLRAALASIASIEPPGFRKADEDELEEARSIASAALKEPQ